MLSIDDCWATLESGLGEQALELPSGVEPKALDEAEGTMNVVLPDDLRRFLRRHDGSGHFHVSPCQRGGGGGFFFLCLHDIVSYWQGNTEVGSEFESEGEFGAQMGPIKHNFWSCRWIPLTHNGSGDHIFIDLDPPESGNTGQVVDWGHEAGESTYLAPNLTAWLNEVVANFGKGRCEFCKY